MATRLGWNSVDRMDDGRIKSDEELILRDLEINRVYIKRKMCEQSKKGN
jgi:hypothetical protein